MIISIKRSKTCVEKAYYRHILVLCNSAHFWKSKITLWLSNQVEVLPIEILPSEICKASLGMRSRPQNWNLLRLVIYLIGIIRGIRLEHEPWHLRVRITDERMKQFHMILKSMILIDEVISSVKIPPDRVGHKVISSWFSRRQTNVGSLVCSQCRL